MISNPCQYGSCTSLITYSDILWARNNDNYAKCLVYLLLFWQNYTFLFLKQFQNQRNPFFNLRQLSGKYLYRQKSTSSKNVIISISQDSFLTSFAFIENRAGLSYSYNKSLQGVYNILVLVIQGVYNSSIGAAGHP